MKTNILPLITVTAALTFIVILTGSCQAQGDSVKFEIEKLECIPSQIYIGEKVTIKVEIRGMANKQNNVILKVTDPDGQTSQTQLSILTGGSGVGSGSVKYPDDFFPKNKAGTNKVGRYEVEAHYKTAWFYCGFLVIDESHLGTAAPLMGGFAAVAFISLVKKSARQLNVLNITK